MRSAIFIFVFLLKIIPSHAQSYQLIASIQIHEPKEVSIDRVGNIYFSAYNGDIVKYDPSLKEKLVFSPVNPNTTTILEAWQGLRIFSFHRDLQQYRLINRNLSLNEDYNFPLELVGFVEVATPTYDNNVWLVDQTDFSLKKYNIFQKNIETTTPLNLLLNPDSYEILHCKEYQNRLFISTRDVGILIFDNFGNYIKTHENTDVSFFNFWGDRMYFIKDDALVTVNLYNDDTLTSKLPTNADWIFALVFDDRTYLFSRNHLALYK